jgi:hypothetical protein
MGVNGLKFIMLSDFTEEFDFDEINLDESDFQEGSIWTYAGEVDSDLYIPCGEGDLSRVFRKGSSYISIVSDQMKPLLHPLSDLTNPIKVEGHNNGKEFVPIDEFFIMYGGGFKDKKAFLNTGLIDSILNSSYESYTYSLISKLFEWHFDVFGLIKSGLAIDINTL